MRIDYSVMPGVRNCSVVRSMYSILPSKGISV
jgi:hypothetical protein